MFSLSDPLSRALRLALLVLPVAAACGSADEAGLAPLGGADNLGAPCDANGGCLVPGAICVAVSSGAAAVCLSPCAADSACPPGAACLGLPRETAAGYCAAACGGTPPVACPAEHRCRQVPGSPGDGFHCAVDP